MSGANLAVTQHHLLVFRRKQKSEIWYQCWHAHACKEDDTNGVDMVNVEHTVSQTIRQASKMLCAILLGIVLGGARPRLYWAVVNKRHKTQLHLLKGSACLSKAMYEAQKITLAKFMLSHKTKQMLPTKPSKFATRKGVHVAIYFPNNSL